MTQRLEAYIESDLIEDEYFNFSVRVHASMIANHYILKMAFSYVAGLYFQLKVRAVSEWNAEGEWAVDSVPQTLTEPSAAERAFSVMTLVTTP